MRIWDLNPGYLNRQSLLGEHRELHGIVSIIANHKSGYSRHPETLRWVGHGWALRQRHGLLAAEMALRGYTDRSPVDLAGREGIWPAIYIDEPARQLQILGTKYRDKEQGRIPLPASAQQLWSQHKYSVLARDAAFYRRLGPDVAAIRPGDDFAELARVLVELLRQPPAVGGLRNALQHMWGHVSEHSVVPKGEVDSWSLQRLLKEIQHRALACGEPYLLASTALSELAAWLPEAEA